MVAYEVVVPTVGRPSLSVLLAGLLCSPGPPPRRIVVVDDRRSRSQPLLAAGAPGADRDGVLDVVEGPGRGPAAARNAGWRTTLSDWVAFLDDDVEPGPGWCERLAADLGSLPGEVAGSQGRISVPLPADRRPTDWERNVAGLEHAAWATADMAYRRTALLASGGFDERFPRAYREDAELALRLRRAGWRLVRGERQVRHPVRPAPPWVSIRLQAGNRDDAVMRAIHGRGWRAAAAAPAGRFRRHLATVTAAAATGLAARAGRRRLAALGAAAWAAGTIELAAARLAGAERSVREVATTLATSPVLPVAAVAHRARGLVAARAAGRTGPEVVAPPPSSAGRAVLFDRDGTLVRDVPHNGDPDLVEPLAGVQEALRRLRRAGIPVGVISNQSGVARGLLSERDVHAVNRRIDGQLGPFATWQWCPHGPGDGCGCRKPEPGLVASAAAALGLAPGACVVIGDIGSDVEAARAAGARGILVPTAATRPDEIGAAPEVLEDVAGAVALLLEERP